MSAHNLSPILERDDIVQILEKTLAQFIQAPLLGDARDYSLRVSSGTGGSPHVGILKNRPTPEYLDWFFGTSKQIILCVGTNATRLPYLSYLPKAAQADAQVMIVSQQDLVPELEDLIAEFKPDTFVGVPSYMARVASFMDPTDALAVTTVRLWGEILTPVTGKLLRETFPSADISMLYTSNETGSISFPACRLLPPNTYHPRQGIELELLHPDSLGVGELLISMEIFPGVSIGRYRIGDVARIERTSCACGAATTFEILGRTNVDFVTLSGAMLRKDEFDRIARALHFDDYRVELSEQVEDKRVQGTVHLFVYNKAGMGTAALEQEIGERVSKALKITPTRTYSDLVQERSFRPLQMSFVAKPFESNKDVRFIRV